MLLWLLRATWVALPLTAGSAFAAAFDGRSLPVQTTASVGLWALWAGVLSASLIRLPLTLTIVRVVAPAALVAMLLAELTTGGIRLDLIATIAPLAFAYMPEVGIEFVNGPSYPNERRFPLRPPGLLLLGPVPVAWAVVVGLPAAGALLLAARVWALGAIALAAGAGAVVVLGRSLYGLSRRWIVFVPAGVVIHDPMALADPVLFPREHIVRLALAPVGADERAFDLTMRAFGNAIELDLDEPAPLAMLRGQTAEVQSLLVAPTRPGAVLSYRAMPAPTTASPS